MAALTWRQVSAPHFGDSNSLLATGAQLQGNAFSALGDAIQKYQQQQSAQQQATADSAVLARALQVNDPAAYQKALSDGTFLSGVNPATVSPQVLGALGSRATALQNLAGTQYDQNRTQTQDQLQDAARAQQAARLGLSGPLAQLSPEQQRQALAQETSITGGVLNNTNRAFQNQVQSRDDAANDVGLTAATNIMRQSAGPMDALAELEQMNDLTPREFANTADRLAKTFGNLYAPQGAAPAGGGKGAPGTRSGSPYDATFNFQGTSAPISSMPISDVLKVQEQSRTTQGHSPMGAFQINKATLEDFGPRVLGKDWQNQEFTPEAQEKVARAIFEDRKGGDLSKTWASLPNSSPGAYKNFSWDDMRSIIAQGEVGQNLPSDSASLRLLTQASQQDYGRRISQNNATGVTADVQRNLSDTRAPAEVANDLIKNQFTGANMDDVLGTISRIQRNNPGLSAADAGSILARSARDSTWWKPDGTTGLGGGIGFDDATLEQNTKDYVQGKADRSALSNQLTQAESQKLATAQQNYDTAMQNLMALNRRQQAQPGISTERAEAEFERAEAALKKALATQRQQPSSRPVR